MKLAEFNKLRKNCPWYYVATNWDKSKRCMATDRGQRLDVTASDYGKDCGKKNCAVLYWLNRR